MPVRHRVIVRGTVQGVGFRPFIYRLANELGLHGWVSNSSQGVTIEVEGPGDRLDTFERRLETDLPPHAVVYSTERSVLEPAGLGGGFSIHESHTGGPIVVPVLPDLATCPECLAEIRDPSNRRYRYPFTNCTHCGPRFTIVEGLPYDRPNTTMRGFELCEHCRREYEDPSDRRYHAQPVACPQCGPWLEWWDGDGVARAQGDAALQRAADAIREGRIVALKGLGGFQLLVDAGNEEAVAQLRKRKHRDEKPFALMAPSLEWVQSMCEVTDVERRALTSPQAPIVLLRRAAGGTGVSPSVAPDNPFLGVMLPYTPLHHLLLDDLSVAVVATSGNIAEEPIITDEREAVERLVGIADVFLVHNRPIARHADDSVVRIAAGRELMIRRARGYAPLPVPVAGIDNEPTLALGAHQKNAVALSIDGAAVIGQHIGDLATAPAYTAMVRSASDLPRLYDREPGRIACDAHPDYLSTRHAESLSPSPVRVQHHLAHVMSCAAENELRAPFLGVSWDGTGYGLDDTVWGGEFLEVDPCRPSQWRRLARLRPFRLPGGDTAVREPRRSAMGALHALFGDEAFEIDSESSRAFTDSERRVIADMLRKGVNSPVTSSAGRLFDAVASLAGIRHRTSFEGQAAMELEYAAHRWSGTRRSYPCRVIEPENGPWMVDWGETLRALMDDRAGGAQPAAVAAAFHHTVIDMIAAVVERANAERVVLSGGCFQNLILLEGVIERLQRMDRKPYWHQRIAPNDGGIALGQIAVAAALEEEA
jgi:hydrogenase maturation protein HypF